MPSATDFPVKWIEAGMPRAPALTLQPGSLVALLDAFLVTGWGAMTPQRVHVQGGIATVQCNAGDGFWEHTVIDIAGADDAALNGTTRVLTSTSTSFTFATEAADGYATGTISIKAAPAGWEKVFAGENKAVYKNTMPDAPQHFLHIDASEGYRAGVRGFASMADIDSGDYPFPPIGTDSFFFSGWQSGSGRQRYFLAADKAACIFALAASINSFNTASAGGYAPFFFGALAPLVGASSQENTCAALCALRVWQNDAQGWCGAVFSRERGGSYMAGRRTGYDGSAVGASFVSTKEKTMPPVGIEESPTLFCCLCQDADAIRGAVPGLFACTHSNAHTNIAALETFQGGRTLGGRRFIAVPSLDNATSYWANDDRGRFFVDITGPWR